MWYFDGFTASGYPFVIAALLGINRNTPSKRISITDKKVTSLEAELGRKMDMEEVKEKLKYHLADIFGMQLLGDWNDGRME